MDGMALYSRFGFGPGNCICTCTQRFQFFFFVCTSVDLTAILYIISTRFFFLGLLVMMLTWLQTHLACFTPKEGGPCSSIEERKKNSTMLQLQTTAGLLPGKQDMTPILNFTQK